MWSHYKLQYLLLLGVIFSYSGVANSLINITGASLSCISRGKVFHPSIFSWSETKLWQEWLEISYCIYSYPNTSVYTKKAVINKLIATQFMDIFMCNIIASDCVQAANIRTAAIIIVAIKRIKYFVENRHAVVYFPTTIGIFWSNGWLR